MDTNFENEQGCLGLSAGKKLSIYFTRPEIIEKSSALLIESQKR